MKKPRLNYVELPVADGPAAKAFYERAFGWKLTDFGPTYHATTSGDVDIGLDASQPQSLDAPLPVIEVDDLESALAAVGKAGGTITKPIFAFPGGRRFHFRDPAGNQLAVWQAAGHASSS